MYCYCPSIHPGGRPVPLATDVAGAAVAVLQDESVYSTLPLLVGWLAVLGIVLVVADALDGLAVIRASVHAEDALGSFLDAAGFAEVGHHGALVVALFDFAR